MAATKTVHRLQLPYLTPEWPFISKDDETRITRHLIDLLKPIGEHRRSNVTPSKGRREKKRRPQEQDGAKEGAEVAVTTHSAMPSIFNSLTIGFNSTIRSLEAISQHSKPKALKDVDNETQEPLVQCQKLGAVFVCRPVLPDLITMSTPLLIATASQAQPEDPHIRLVQLSASAETQLAETLNQPRVGFLGVQVTKDTDVLLALVRAAVAPIQVPWLNHSEAPKYLPLKVESAETTVGSNKR